LIEETVMRHTITRRHLLQSAAGAAVGAWGLTVRPSAADETASPVRILAPVHGAVLNHRHGQQTAEGLTIRVSGQCRPGDRVTVNGTACRVAGSCFTGTVVLRSPETDLVAVADGGGDRSESRVRVVWDRYSAPRYRFMIDDNSYFLRDIAQNNYASLFDGFYLKKLRELHKKYGTKFCLNIYYAAADGLDFPSPSSFRLPQFPDRYKGEWRDNAHWLKLAFHAYANKPDNPYAEVPAERLIADLDLVAAEIRRFAGEEAYAPPIGIHWGMAPRSAFRPLYARGVRTLAGLFAKRNGQWIVNYNWDPEHSQRIAEQDVWKDFESGIIFCVDNITCNLVPLDRTAAVLEASIKDPTKAEIIKIITHEQYFWPFFRKYLPDHFQRIETALRWVTERGYKPVFFHEGLLGGRV
jgi:hypothetical protein